MAKANFRRGRSGAFIRRDNRPLVLTQTPTTFEGTGFMSEVLLSMSDPWSRYFNNDDPANPGDVAGSISQYQRLAFDMLQKGFNVPRCMLTL
jgi:hypothetical protein